MPLVQDSFKEHEDTPYSKGIYSSMLHETKEPNHFLALVRVTLVAGSRAAGEVFSSTPFALRAPEDEAAPDELFDFAPELPVVERTPFTLDAPGVFLSVIAINSTSTSYSSSLAVLSVSGMRGVRVAFGRRETGPTEASAAFPLRLRDLGGAGVMMASASRM